MMTHQLTSKRFEFADASDAIEHYFEQGWTDGLPIVPPTAAKIGAFLDTLGRSPAEILGTEPVRGRVVTLEKVAINAVMAGCRPEFFPVVVAAVEAMLEPQYNLHAVTASTMGAAQFLVVNGPIAKEIGLNSGVGVFGPGHRANATIGRAVRLTIINVTGAISGELDQATLGHAGKYTWCVAEAEDASPWEPLHAGRGFTPEQSSVSVFSGLAPIQVTSNTGNTPEEVLTGVIDGLFVAGPGNWPKSSWSLPRRISVTSEPLDGRRSRWPSSSGSAVEGRRRSGRRAALRSRAPRQTNRSASPKARKALPSSSRGDGPEDSRRLFLFGVAGRTRGPSRSRFSRSTMAEIRTGGTNAMTTMLEVFDPTVEPIPAHGVIARRPDTLNGMVIGLLANGKRNADLLLEMVHDVLADQFEFKAVITRNKGNASRPCPKDIVAELADQCDVVITGNGD